MGKGGKEKEKKVKLSESNEIKTEAAHPSGNTETELEIAELPAYPLTTTESGT